MRFRQTDRVPPVGAIHCITAIISNVSAQDTPAALFGVSAAEGSAAGEVVVSWDAVAAAQFYRVGWVALSDYKRYRPALG